MKKYLLTLACATAMAASAQQIGKIENVANGNFAFSKVALDKKAVISMTKKSDAPLKSAKEGVYYRTPAGSMWVAVPQPFYAYNTPMHVIAPWTEFKYVNMSDKKNGTWGMQLADSFIDLTDDVDENCNLNDYYSGCAGAYYAPQYTESGVTYIPTHTLRDGSKETMLNYVYGVTFSTFSPMNVDGAVIYSRGVLDNENLFGAGKHDGIAMGGIETCYPKPMSPLYVEYAAAYGRVAGGKDALSGKTLTMSIYNLDDENAEPLVLTCTSEDLEFDSEDNEGTKYYMVKFTKKVIDEISGETVPDPFVIDYPSVVVISGFDQAGVNLGLGGYTIADEFASDSEAENHSYCTYFDAVENTTKGFTYQGNTVVALGFQSMFDICSVVTEIEAMDGNVYPADGITVSDDGQTYGNSVFTDVKGVQVCTALAWKDAETDEEMYWSDDMYDYDWIQNLVVEGAVNQNNKEYGLYYVGAVCDPLPAGVDKRYAVIHLNGRGVVSEDIYVLQGNITLEEAKAAHAAAGINKVENNGVKTNNKVYNLNGQQVGKNFKGIVIENGKKVFKK